MSAEYARDWLIKNGWLPHQAAAVAGHLVQESGVRPAGVVGDNGTAFGIAQWRGPRFQALQQYAAERGANWQNMDTQLGFLNHELQTTERRAGDALRASTDVRGATRAFMGYERPQGYTAANPELGHGWQNRLTAAQRLAGEQPSIATQFAPPSAPVAAPVAAPVMDPAAGVLAQAFAADDQTAARQRQEADAKARKRQELFGQVGGMFA